MQTAEGVFYPDTTPNPQRLPDGSLVTPSGAVLPFAASCPPNTTPNPATLACDPWPGARNINWECGGALVPAGAAGCQSLPLTETMPPGFEERALRTSGDLISWTRDSWSSCYRDDLPLDQVRPILTTGEPKQSSDVVVCVLLAALLGFVILGAKRG